MSDAKGWLDHIRLAKEYADIRRGDHPTWKGDRVANGEAFAFRIGFAFEDADDFVTSLRIAEPEYSKLTGLPPRSLQILAQHIQRGIAERLRQKGDPA